MRNKRKRIKKLWRWRQKLYQGLIEKGTFVEICYLDPLPRGSGELKTVIGQVVEQKLHLFYVLRKYSSNIIRIRKNQVFMISSRVKRKKNKRRKINEKSTPNKKQLA